MRTSSSKLARRYAKALVGLCDERGDGEAVRADLDTLATLWTEQPDAGRFLADPTVPLPARKKTLTEVLDAANIQGTARPFVLVLLDKGRIDELIRIRDEFAALIDARTGRVQAEVVSAAPLADPALDRLRALLERMLDKQVVLSPSVDADLLGGLVVRVGNTVYDASVRNHLNRLRHQLVGD